jgi:hypothetical protein
VFRVSAFWWLQKKAKPFPSPLVFLEFLCMRVASIVYLDFLDAHGGYYTAIVYIHLHSFFAIQFNDTWEFHLSLLCALYIYVCACISFWLISFYLWLVLIFLFSKVSYGFTPLRHCMSRHYTSRQIYVWLLTNPYITNPYLVTILDEKWMKIWKPIYE